MKFIRPKTYVVFALVKEYWKDLFLNSKFKVRGNTLLVSIFLSGIMLSVGIMAARLAVQEVGLAADLYLSEKAYFSAESGVERALLKLKVEPLNHILPTPDPANIIPNLEDSNTQVTIRNKILENINPDELFQKDAFSFRLKPLQSQKFRFRYDNNGTFAYSESVVGSPVDVSISSDTAPSATGKFFWRFLCQDNSIQPKTIALQAEQYGSTNDLTSVNGRDDDGGLFTFSNWPASAVNKSTCYLSIQNTTDVVSNDDGVRTFTFSGTKMAPHTAHIHAFGLHQGREKHIRFDYAQKTLGSLFDFSFLHSKNRP